MSEKQNAPKAPADKTKSAEPTRKLASASRCEVVGI